MSVTAALNVYNPNVVAYLRRRASLCISELERKECLALALHLEMGRIRFDAMRSKESLYCFMEEGPSTAKVTQRIVSASCDTVQHLLRTEAYYSEISRTQQRLKLLKK